MPSFAGRYKDFSISGETFELWEAPGGRYRFTYPVPENLAPYYDSGAYLSHHSEEAGLVPALYRLLRRVNTAWKIRLIKQYVQPPESRIKALDFGCGTGHFAQACIRAGWQTTGVETDQDAAAAAAAHNGLDVYRSLEELKHDSGFDVITAWHVLEHVPQPRRTLADFHRRLAPGGIALIAVPNFSSFDAQFYDTTWAGYDVPRHLHHFTPGFLEELAVGQGFRPVALHRMLLDAFFVSLLSEQYSGSGPAGSLRAALTGLRSNLHALKNPRKCSAFVSVFQKV